MKFKDAFTTQIAAAVPLNMHQAAELIAARAQKMDARQLVEYIKEIIPKIGNDFMLYYMEATVGRITVMRMWHSEFVVRCEDAEFDGEWEVGGSTSATPIRRA